MGTGSGRETSQLVPILLQVDYPDVPWQDDHNMYVPEHAEVNVYPNRPTFALKPFCSISVERLVHFPKINHIAYIPIIFIYI